MLKLTLHVQRKGMRPSVNFQTVSMWQSKNMTDNQLPYHGESTVVSLSLEMEGGSWLTS